MSTDVKNVVINASLLPVSSRRVTRKSILPAGAEKKTRKNANTDSSEGAEVTEAPSVPKEAPSVPKLPKVVVATPAVAPAPAPAPTKKVVIAAAPAAAHQPKAVQIVPAVVAPAKPKGIVVSGTRSPVKPVVVVAAAAAAAKPPHAKQPQPTRKTVVQVIEKPKKSKPVPKTLKKTDTIVVAVAPAQTKPKTVAAVQPRKTAKHTPTKQRSIKLSTTAKRKRDAVEKIKTDIETVPIKTIKDKLVGAGLITAGSRAPDDVLRDMYKNHTLAGGVILVTRLMEKK